jgi:hypothetical protein
MKYFKLYKRHNSWKADFCNLSISRNLSKTAAIEMKAGVFSNTVARSEASQWKEIL